MSRESNYQGFAASGDTIYIPFYNVESVSINIQRIDNADSTGDVFAKNNIIKQYYTGDALYKFDGPLALYDFTAANPNAGNIVNTASLFRSTASVPVESISGRAVALSGGILTAGTYTFPRFGNKCFHIPPSVQVTDTTSGIISAQENAGFGWSYSQWIYRQGNTVPANLYVETNAALTKYFSIQLNANGTISLTDTGIIGYTTPIGSAIPMFSWTHLLLTYDATNMRLFLNGSLSTGPTARAHYTGFASTSQRLNQSPAGQHFTQNAAVFNKVLTAAQANRQFNDPTGQDYWAGGIFSQGGTMGQGSTFNVIFTNNIQPGNSQNASISWAVLPITGLGQIQFIGPAAASYVFEMKIIEREAIS